MQDILRELLETGEKRKRVILKRMAAETADQWARAINTGARKEGEGGKDIIT